MTNYNMLFEEIVLGAWGKLWRREDPFKMGDADTLGLADDNLSGQYGQDAKFALSAALKVVAAKQPEDIQDSLLSLDKKVWEAKKYDDICKILEATKGIFNKIGIAIV